jgi:hypothetical protein
MFTMTHVADEEPPSTQAAQLVGKASRYLLLILCASPIALFPVALAVRTYGYLFP